MKSIIENFKRIPGGYGLVPFWFWNDDLKDEHLIFQIEEMYDKGIEEFIVHARRGLSVEYLSEEWFSKIKLTVEEAQKRGMGVWFYDENNWPSGYANGKVIAADPEAREKYLGRVKIGEKLPCDTILIVEKDGYQYYRGYGQRPVTYSDECYIDLLDSRAADLFVEFTHNEYYKRFKEYFGTTIKGFFVDEPGFYVNLDYFAPCEAPRADWYSITWTDKFPDEFIKEKGYDIMEYLPHIWEDVSSDSYKYRVDYYDVVGKLYRDNFLNVIKEYCESKGVKSIGHLHLEDCMSYHVRTQGDLMQGISCLHYAGVDRIDPNPQKNSEKFASSTEHCYGMGRTMSETYALLDWELRPRDIKRWANWQFVRGINMLVPHAFFSSIDGDRVEESPPSLFYQNYYWRYFSKFSSFIKRLGYILTQGVHSCPVAVYYPITTHQELVTPTDTKQSFYKDYFLTEVTCGLLNHQIDYDFVNDMALKKSDCDNGKLKINDEEYKVLIFAGVTNLSKIAVKTAVDFLRKGGYVILLGETDAKNVSFQDDNSFNLLKNEMFAHPNFDYWYGMLARQSFCSPFNSDKLASYISEKGATDIELVKPDCDIKYMRRIIGDNVLYYFINESETDKVFKVRIREKNPIVKLDPHNGNVIMYSNAVILKDSKWGTEVSAKLAGFDELILLVTNEDITTTDIENIDIESEDFNCRFIAKNWKAFVEETYVFEKGTQKQESSKNICIDGHLSDWDKWGQEFFSGVVRYENSFYINFDKNTNYVLDLGEVAHSVEVYVNGDYVDSMVWAPYKLNISKYIKDGKNDIVLRVSNILGNHIKKIGYPAGLLGPVRIVSNSKE